MKRSPGTRKTSNLSTSVHQQLNAYALAASAAGVGMLALTQPAEAKIVYTPAHVVIGAPIPLDLNHDGIADFYVLEGGSHFGGERSLFVCQSVGSGGSGPFCSYSKVTNSIRATLSMGKDFGAALRSGARIQHGNRFVADLPLGTVVGYSSTSSRTDWFGPWFNGGKGVKRRYLGLRFKIKGRFHFGWARITVTTSKDRKNFTATLTGYAYETIPGRAIVAGQTKGLDDVGVESSNAPLTTPALGPATLGMLALGAPALSVMRGKSGQAAKLHSSKFTMKQ